MSSDLTTADAVRDSTASSGARKRAGRAVRPGAVLALVLTGQLMAVIDNSIVNVAVPSMQTSLHASGASLQLIVAGYTIAYAVLLVTGARLGDILGHRTMFLGGVALFTLASLGCGLAPDTGALIGLRFVQGIGAATMIPQVLSLIQRTYTRPGPRARAMSFYATVLSGGAVLGQILGGLLVTANIGGAGWRPIFLVNVPFGIVVLVLGARALPRSSARDGRSLDFPGLAVLTPAVLALVLPLVLGQPLGWPAWGWALLAVSAAAFTVLPLVERRVAARGGQPILPRSLLSLPGVTPGIAGLFVVMAVFGGWLFVFALEMQDGLGGSALRSGLTFVPSAVAFALVSLNWQRLPARWHVAVSITGFIVNSSGLVLAALLLRSGGSGGAGVYAFGALTGGGMAAAFGPLMTRVLSRVPVVQAADASGLIVTVNQLGIVVGIATFGTLYLNLAGQLPAHLSAAFTLTSAHAYLVTSSALAVLALIGAVLAAAHARGSKVPA
ncbi:MAG TPA: MFS transporter [Trebonia sp.]|jgi:MFS family permease